MRLLKPPFLLLLLLLQGGGLWWTPPALAVYKSTALMMYETVAEMPSTLISREPLFIVELLEPDGIALPAGAELLVATEHYWLVRATTPARQLLAASPGVRRLEPSCRLQLVLDRSREAVNLGDSWQSVPGGFSGYSGQGVILGTVDTGIDPDHPDFFKADSSGSRIFLLDDRDANRLWTNAEIASGICTSRDTNGHGTHVAGIMSGNGNSSAARLYAGMAPAAELIIVKSDQLYTDLIISGVEFIYSRAAALQRPAVVNLSLETRQGPHDGTSAFERMLSELTGPGRLLTAAVGNAGEMCIHDQQIISGNGGGELRFTTGGEGADYLLVDIWLDCDIAPGLVAYTPDGTGYEIEVGNATPRNLGTLGILQFSRPPTPDPGNLKYNATFHLADSPDNLTWRILLSNNDAVALNLDAWSYNAEFIDGGCLATGSVSSPATADSAIAVGAYVSRVNWPSMLGPRQYVNPPPLGTVAPFSNHGPGINGALIPTLVAPGMGVLAPLSAAVNISGNEDLITPGGSYILMQGTSMAAPQVAGALGLALQKKPHLGCRQTQLLLRETAALLAGQSDWEEAAGAGLLDVSALLEALAPSLRLEAGPLYLLLTWSLSPDDLPDQFQLRRHSESAGADTTFLINSVAGEAAYRWLDTAVLPQELYEYRLSGHDQEGEELWSSSTVSGSAAPLNEALAIALYPNPSDGQLTLRVAALQAGGAELVVWDLLGRELHRSTTTLEQGITEIPLSLTAASGAIFVALEKDGQLSVSKGLLLPGR